MPTPSKAAEMASIGLLSGPMTYHGGPVMQKANTYAIFWGPPTLQTGASTGFSPHYQNVVSAFLTLYPGHGLAKVGCKVWIMI